MVGYTGSGASTCVASDNVPFFSESPVSGFFSAFPPTLCVRIDLALLAAETVKKP